MENQITIETLQQALNDDIELKGWFDSQIDSKANHRTTKAIEKYKLNEVPTLIENEINKRYPPETEEQKQLKEYQKRLEEMEREKTELSLKSEYKDILVSKEIPLELVNFIAVEGNKEESLKRIDLFDELLKPYIEKRVNSGVAERFKQGMYTPPTSDKEIKYKRSPNIEDIIRRR